MCKCQSLSPQGQISFGGRVQSETQVSAADDPGEDDAGC